MAPYRRILERTIDMHRDLDSRAIVYWSIDIKEHREPGRMDEPAPASRHPLRACPDRAEDDAQSLLPEPALHQLRRRGPGGSRPPARNEGRGGLGGHQHRVLLRSSLQRFATADLRPALGR